MKVYLIFKFIIFLSKKNLQTIYLSKW